MARRTEDVLVCTKLGDVITRCLRSIDAICTVVSCLTLRADVRVIGVVDVVAHLTGALLTRDLVTDLIGATVATSPCRRVEVLILTGTGG